MAPEINSGLYTARGDVRRSSHSFVIIALFNIMLDSVLIYVLDLGIAGASLATIVASICGLIYMNIGQSFSRDIMFPVPNLKFKLQLGIFKELLIVSIPVAFNELIRSLFSISINYLIIFTAGVGEIASYVIVKQLIRFVFIPAISTGSVFITVAGATYASKLWDKFKEGLNYATMLSLSVTISVSLIFFIFAHPICSIFSLTLTDPAVIDRASEILMIQTFMYVLSPLQIMAIKSFQGMGKGFISLGMSILSQVLVTLAFAYLFGIILNMGVFGIYSGLVVGYSLASIICFVIIKLYIRKLENESGAVVLN